MTNEMRKRFKALKDYIDPEMMMYEEEGDGIYFFNTDIKKGYMLFETHGDDVVLWFDGLMELHKDKRKIYTEAVTILKSNVIFAFLENEKERDLLIELGAERVDFKDEYDGGYNQEFGSYILRYTGA